jgi:hypothetical protein
LKQFIHEMEQWGNIRIMQVSANNATSS